MMGDRSGVTWWRYPDGPGGLGLFIRGLVGLDRAAAMAPFGQFLNESTYSASQIRFVTLIVDDLTQTASSLLGASTNRRSPT